ncbi:MAG TPA: hypothetical protein DEP84_16400 [Chloroflexi bacterium]|nr:hypothetical protein [Chloroflexota bacterium]
MIEVEATVIEFIPNAMHDEFDSGAFASYDATRLRLLAPPHLRGNTLTIYHNESPAATSPWREINRKMRFSMKEGDLKGEQLLFDGAVYDVRDAT